MKIMLKLKWLVYMYAVLILIMLAFLRRLRPHYLFSESIEKYGISSRIGGASEDKLYEVYQGRYQNKALSNYKSTPQCQ